MSGKKTVFSNLLLLVTALVWGLAFSAQKVASANMPAFAINGFRFLLGGIVLIPATLFFDRAFKNGRHLFSRKNRRLLDLTRTELLGGALCGAVLLLATTLQQLSLSSDHVSPGKASFLTALYVVFVPLFGLLRRKIAAPNVWVSVVIAIAGAYLLTSGGMGGLSLGIYDILLLLSAASFALHITVIDIFVPLVDGVRMSMVQFFVAGILCIPFILFGPAFTGADFAASLPSLLYLGLLSCGLAYTAQIVGQKLSGTPTVASLIMSLESVFGLLGGAVLLGERMNGYQISGCAVIFFAVVFSQLPIGSWVSALRAKRRRGAAAEAEAASLPDSSPKKPK